MTSRKWSDVSLMSSVPFMFSSFTEFHDRRVSWGGVVVLLEHAREAPESLDFQLPGQLWSRFTSRRRCSALTGCKYDHVLLDY